MSRSRLLLIFALTLFGVAAVRLTNGTSRATDPPAIRTAQPKLPQVSLYHEDPDHLWNRLHAALLVRIGPDGRTYGRDRIEPLLWRESTHLLLGPSHASALRVLNEFSTKKGESLIKDPLRRALLQRDLIMIRRWLNYQHYIRQGAPAEERRQTTQKLETAKKRLRGPLTTAIERLALSAEKIGKLPDNYALAVTSGKIAKRYDPMKPSAPYLPPDLFQPDGAWVPLGRRDGPVAPMHLREPNPFNNSTFLTFLRLPGGRAATIKYLERLGSFDQPLFVKASARGRRRGGYVPNPKLPQFPVGTQTALVRRAMLIDTENRVRPTTLTESVQLRVYREIPESGAKALDAALVGGTAANRKARNWQSFHELRMSRTELFAGRAGGLVALGNDERDFKTGFGAHPWDEFQRPLTSGRTFLEQSQRAVRESCFACHSLPGAYSLNSHFNFRIADWRNGKNANAAKLSATTVAAEERAIIKWRQARHP